MVGQDESNVVEGLGKEVRKTGAQMECLELVGHS